MRRGPDRNGSGLGHALPGGPGAVTDGHVPDGGGKPELGHVGVDALEIARPDRVELVPDSNVRTGADLPIEFPPGSGVRTGVLVGDPFTITVAIWAAVHGVVSLAMAGCLPGEMTIDEGLFAATAAATVRGFLAGSE